MMNTSTARFAPTTTIDAATLTGLYRLLGDDLGQVIDTYVEGLPTVLSALDTAVATGDLATARWMAHRLKGSSAALGAPVLAAQCQNLQYASTLEEAHLWAQGIADHAAQFVTVLQRAWRSRMTAA